MTDLLAQLSPFEAPSIDWWALVPQMILVGAALVLLLVTSMSPKAIPAWFSTASSVLAAVAAFVVTMGLWYDVRDDGPRTTIADAFTVDGFSLYFGVLICVGIVATALLADGYIKREAMAAPEFHALLLSSAAGAMVMASANDLIVMFLGLESLSIALYVLIAMHMRRPEAREAAMKYFVLGAFASAFLLYGIALVYGATGSTNLTHISSYLDSVVLRDETILMTGLALLLVGLAFKVAAAPFHFWAPDVYQGAPSPVTGYMASIAKAAGFAALLRIFVYTFAGSEVEWTPIVTGLAIVTLAVGAVMAITQTDVKRMLAFSSISHAGFLLVAVQAASDGGTSAALFYLFAYTLMAIGSFAVVGLMGWDEGHAIGRYSGLARSRPWMAFAFTVFLLAQAGVPLTSGFVAKFLVISESVNSRNYVLAAIAMFAAVISAFMYLRIVMAMYVGDDDSDKPGERPAIPKASAFVLAGAFLFTVIVGFIPQFLIEFSRDAVSMLVAG
jgi:NADH-quinone oxidoreductase subunit N